jgi:hypothetical protein
MQIYFFFDFAYNIFILFCISGCCTIQRFKILATPFFFSVFLVAADIISDIVTAAKLYSRGHVYWSLLTGLLTLAPFLGRLVLYLDNLSRCYKVTWREHKYFGKKQIPKIETIDARLTFWWQELKQFWWHIPWFLPLRCVFSYYIISIQMF